MPDLIAFEMLVELGARVPADRLDETTRELHRELGERRLAVIRLLERASPPLSKSGSAVAPGSLLVTVSREQTPRFLEAVRDWLRRQPARCRLALRSPSGAPRVLRLGVSELDQPDLLARLAALETDLNTQAAR